SFNESGSAARVQSIQPRLSPRADGAIRLGRREPRRLPKTLVGLCHCRRCNWTVRVAGKRHCTAAAGHEPQLGRNPVRSSRYPYPCRRMDLVEADQILLAVREDGYQAILPGKNSAKRSL